MLKQCGALAAAETAHVLALQLMPDHVHIVARLGTRNSLGDAVRQLKGPLTPLLRERTIRWQTGGYFDHRLRCDDELAPILRYMLTNPYRKGLVAWDQTWPFWFCATEIWAWFGPTTSGGLPFREWAKEPSPGSP